MGDIEHIQEQNTDIQTICNEIDHYIQLFCEEQNINNIITISQSVWSGCLMYVRYNYIKPSKVLKDSSSIYGAYNIPLCEKIAEYYIFLCKKYDKECSIKGFEYLTDISSETLYKWYNGNGKYYGVSSQRSDIAKKLHSERENSLSEKLLTGKNPVGVLGILNHFYGWSGVGNMTEDRTKQAATLTDASAGVLELCDNSGGSGDGLAENRQLELSDNFIQKEKP